MFDSRFKPGRDCPVCYVTHDEEIHEATLRIRQWLRAQVNHRFEEQDEAPFAPELAS